MHTCPCACVPGKAASSPWLCSLSYLMMCYCARCLQITAKDEYSPLCTFLETLLTMIWWVLT
jgi:hypothetical protein